MTSPVQTVNAVVQWLNKVLGSKLPTLPFKGVATVLTSLWNKVAPGPLPDPTSPYPWKIKISGTLPDVLPGTKVELDDLSISVTSTVPPLPPKPSWPPVPHHSPHVSEEWTARHNKSGQPVVQSKMKRKTRLSNQMENRT